jgi:hypothetical protein
MVEPLGFLPAVLMEAPRIVLKRWHCARGLTLLLEPLAVSRYSYFSGDPWFSRSIALLIWFSCSRYCSLSQDLIVKGTLNLKSLKFRVLDEADEMLNMGFVDDVELILGMP